MATQAFHVIANCKRCWIWFQIPQRRGRAPGPAGGGRQFSTVSTTTARPLPNPGSGISSVRSPNVGRSSEIEGDEVRDSSPKSFCIYLSSVPLGNCLYGCLEWSWKTTTSSTNRWWPKDSEAPNASQARSYDTNPSVREYTCQTAEAAGEACQLAGKCPSLRFQQRRNPFHLEGYEEIIWIKSTGKNQTRMKLGWLLKFDNA